MKQSKLPQKTALEVQREILTLKERENELREGLPHLYGWKWYTWARRFYESKNKINLLCAANQISKSSTQIRKMIHWATSPEMWKELWPSWRKGEPIQFWYLYPTSNQADIEFEMKWKTFLPNGAYKTHPLYGWREEWVNKHLFALHFNSGAHIYIKTYAQNVDALQTGTCHAIFCDEELPVELYDELIFRVSATEGYFHMVFTATIGQEFWRLALEPKPGETETLPLADKQIVSMYDCLRYEDDTLTPWTREKIAVVEGRCKNHQEVLKRVHGRFIILSGLKYPTFNFKDHMKPRLQIPKDWHIFGGVDVGSGGDEGHPSAIAFVAVRPDYQFGHVFLGWRGDGIITAAGDVVEKYISLKKEHNFSATQQYYDWGCKDFFTMATRMNEAFLPAEKSHAIGEGILNTLFKNSMISIADDIELQKLANELATLKENCDKRKAKDDFIDALRYAVSQIPWDWSCVSSKLIEEIKESEPTVGMTPREKEIYERRNFVSSNEDEQDRINREFAEINENCEL